MTRSRLKINAREGSYFIGGIINKTNNNRQRSLEQCTIMKLVGCTDVYTYSMFLTNPFAMKPVAFLCMDEIKSTPVSFRCRRRCYLRQHSDSNFLQFRYMRAKGKPPSKRGHLFGCCCCHGSYE